jgi:biotin carboxylase
MTNRTALVLAGGFDQIALITNLQSAGYRVILVDYTVQPVAATFADQQYQDSTLDQARVKQIAEQESASLVVTACTDQALIVAAEVSEQLSLPFPLSSALARQLTNKKWMKAVMSEHGVPTAKYTIIEQSLDMKKLAGFQFPLVCKPVDANSSKGVTKVLSDSELVQAFLYAKASSRSATVVIEEFIEGTELSVDVWVDANGLATVLLVTESLKNPSSAGHFPISASVYPVCSADFISSTLTPLVQQIAKAFALANTPLLVQLVVNDQQTMVLELSARMGGGCKHHLIKHITGVDTMAMLVDTFIGRPTLLPDMTISKHCYIMKYLYALPGQFKQILGLEQLKARNLIEDFYLTRAADTSVVDNSTSSDRVGAVLLKADNFAQLSVLLQQLYQHSKVQSVEAADMTQVDDLDEELIKYDH